MSWAHKAAIAIKLRQLSPKEYLIRLSHARKGNNAHSSSRGNPGGLQAVIGYLQRSAAETDE